MVKLCRISTLLIAGKNYKGVIVRKELGHIFYPFDVQLNQGLLLPRQSKGHAGFEFFKEIILKAIDHSSSSEFSEYVEDIEGDKIKIRDRILELNRNADLPGIKFETDIAA